MVPKADELLIKFVHPHGKKSVVMLFTGSNVLWLHLPTLIHWTGDLLSMMMELYVCHAFRSLLERSPSMQASAATSLSL
jgi:hypothetical protein